MWLTSRCAQSIDHSTNSVTISGSSRRTFKEVIADRRMGLKKDSFASMLQQSIDVLDDEVLSATEVNSSPNFADSADSLANMDTFDSGYDEKFYLWSRLWEIM